MWRWLLRVASAGLGEQRGGFGRHHVSSLPFTPGALESERGGGFADGISGQGNILMLRELKRGLQRFGVHLRIWMVDQVVEQLARLSGIDEAVELGGQR